MELDGVQIVVGGSTLVGALGFMVKWWLSNTETSIKDLAKTTKETLGALRDEIKEVVSLMGDHETRLTTKRLRIERLEAGQDDHETRLDELKGQMSEMLSHAKRCDDDVRMLRKRTHLLISKVTAHALKLGMSPPNLSDADMPDEL